MELFARIKVRNLGDRGKLESVVRELSVKSMVSCWSCNVIQQSIRDALNQTGNIHP
jgi:hypothetical protein